MNLNLRLILPDCSLAKWASALAFASNLVACGSDSTPACDTGSCDRAPDGGDAGTTDAGPYVMDPASLVKTTIGTTAGGNVFPGADFPFGMIQWSPDTWPDRSAGGGYEYSDSFIGGFSLTHISGPGCGAFGDIPVLPM